MDLFSLTVQIVRYVVAKINLNILKFVYPVALTVLHYYLTKAVIIELFILSFIYWSGTFSFSAVKPKKTKNHALGDYFWNEILLLSFAVAVQFSLNCIFYVSATGEIPSGSIMLLRGRTFFTVYNPENHLLSPKYVHTVTCGKRES